MDTQARARAVQLLEREFGPEWSQIVQELGTEGLRQDRKSVV